MIKAVIIFGGLLMATPTLAAPAVTYAPTQRCTPFLGDAKQISGVQQQRADQLIAAFEVNYPAALVDPKRVEAASISPAILQKIVSDLACLATQPGADPFVPEQAAALFASRRYGAQAFDILARNGNTRFAKQMRSYTAVRR